MKFIDLSHPFRHGQKNFPMDPKLSIVPHCTTKDLKYNMTQVTMGTHQGTHLDAMYHFVDAGKTIDRMPLDWFYGEATVLRLPKRAGEEITVADLQKHQASLQAGAKIIYETGTGSSKRTTTFPSLTLEAARYLAGHKIRLLGMDTPTPSRDWFEVHHILLGAEVVVVEGLARLDQAPDRFILSCFPLNFEGRDGSPVRAVAMI